MDKKTQWMNAVRTGADRKMLASLLDGMRTQERVDAMAEVQGALVGALYDRVQGSLPLDLDDIVPPSVPAGATVTFAGRNSLPLFSRFAKRFTRTADGLVFGYNHQSCGLVGLVTGPGYFVVTCAADEHAGELLFDYTVPPPFEPLGWPAYRPNDVLGSRWVFGDLHDYVRRVAVGVLVGSAFRHGADQHAYFTLTSEE